MRCSLSCWYTPASADHVGAPRGCMTSGTPSRSPPSPTGTATAPISPHGCLCCRPSWVTPAPPQRSTTCTPHPSCSAWPHNASTTTSSSSSSNNNNNNNNNGGSVRHDQARPDHARVLHRSPDDPSARQPAHGGELS